MKPLLLFLGIDSLDAHSFASLLNFDFDFLRERFCFLVRAGLRADRGGNLDLAAGLTVETDATELVLDAHGLACAECHRLVKIPRNLFLAGICGADGLRREKQHRGEQSRNRCQTQRRSPENGQLANHYCLVSKTSSSVRCFS